ncbi:sugar phosphate isomerase/epimerase family protein [Cellulosimicrobium sp. NPDC057862]|uniref:sugar phosphate isomerase/epimerase family protein n=1 Tax=Cellulosimicrobium sp. NPDC057862 TaxID=3346266 RepID=UPI00366A7E45
MSKSQMTRRSLIKALATSTVAVGLGAAVAPVANAAPAPTAAGPLAAAGNGRLVPPGKIGIQLYSIRDKVSSLGFRTVFEQLADIGYSEIEFAGYTQGQVGTITPEEIRQLLDDNGLRAVGSHVSLNALRNDLARQLEIANILGMPHVGTANAPTNVNTVDGYRAAADEFNAWGAQASAAGLKLYQHNHAGEFAFATDQPEVRLYDVFFDNTDPRHVFLEMDVYWAFVGQYRFPGFEPIDYVRNNPHRYPLLHLKDGARNEANPNGFDIIEFDAGDLPYREFLRATKARGTRWGIWEQDNAPTTAVPPNPVDSFGNARRSYTSILGLRG